MNLPNKLTVLRLIMAAGYFVLLSALGRDLQGPAWLIDLALAIFLLAVLTDIIDGYLARSRQMITKFGRMIDPLADKILVCGSLIFFVSWTSLVPFIPAWLVVVIIFSELLTQGLRGLIEAKGIPFPSVSWGKNKMAIQSITIVYILFYSGHLINVYWAAVVLNSLIWLTLISTVFSGLSYLVKASKLIHSQEI